ncbi:MAG: hypothetical protein AAF616_01190 [Bacteroidota bacterium]
MKKGLTRLIFIVVFLIPVVWYLFLQLFGTNKFSLVLERDLGECDTATLVRVTYGFDSVSTAKRNYLQRVFYAAEKRSVLMKRQGRDFFDCVNQTEADLVLIDEAGIWGGYELSREGVDRLITELDILLLQKSYGKGTYR